MYDGLLLPVAPDGETNAAIPHATSLAERYDATIHVVSAVDTLERTKGGTRIGSLGKRVETAARKRVESVTAELEDAGIEVVGSVVRDEPLDAIENAIAAADVDLVIMPTRARTGLQRVLLGSITEKVVRVAPVPVVTVPMDGRED